MPRHFPYPSRLSVALCAALACAPLAAAPVPSGFEDLVAGQIEQLDIRVMGQSAGVWPVFVTPDGVQIQQPEQVLAALNLAPGAREALLPALNASLPRNSHLACRYTEPAAGCGYLPPPQQPDAAAAIFDEGEGVLNLFLPRQWLPQASAERERHHRPTAGAQNALLHQQSLNISGGSGYQSLSAQGTGMLGVFRDAHLGLDWTYNRQQSRGGRSYQDLSINDAYLRHDLQRRHYVQLGRMDRRNLSSALGGNFSFAMLPLDRFEGIRFGTTQAYVDQSAMGQGTPLTVLLGRNARVDAYDGERLLQSFYLDSGINDVDTTRFPAGSYIVTLRIYEDGVLVRSEEAPFNKSGINWDDQSLQWFVQGGRVISRDARDHDSALQAGVRVPLRRDLALTLGSAMVDNVAYGEARLEGRKAFGTHEFTGSSALLRGADGSHGTQQQASYRHRVSLNAYHQRMRGGACVGRYLSAESLGCQDSLSGSMSVPVGQGNLYLGYTRRTTYSPRRGDLDLPWFDDTWLLDPPPALFREPQLTRTLQANYNRSLMWGGFNIAARAGVFRQHIGSSNGPRRDQGVTLNMTITRLERSRTSTRQDRLGVDMQHGRDDQAALGYRIGQTRRWESGMGYREVGGELNGRSDHRQGAVISGRQMGSVGTTGATVSHYRGDGRSDTAYSASHTSSFAWTRGGLFWGAELGNGAGVAVQVESPEDLSLQGQAAEVRVSGARRQLLRFGDRRLLPLSSYTATRAEVQDVSSHEVAAAVRVDGHGLGTSLFLPPGRLMMMPIALDLTYTFIGSAHDDEGHALEGARILNAPLPSLGRDGGFIADFPQREKTLYLLQANRLLECPLQVREQRSVVFLVGQVRCRPLAVERLPAKIQQQARVQRLLHEQALMDKVPSVAGAQL